MIFTGKTMTYLETKEILEKLQVFEKGHFCLSSGKHTNTYVDMHKLFLNHEKLNEVIQMIVDSFSGITYNIKTVVGEATIDGKLLTKQVAEKFSRKTGREITPICIEKEDGVFVIKDNEKEILKKKNVLVVKDTLTTGNSTREIIKRVQEAEGTIIAINTVCNLGNVKEEDLGDTFFLHSLYSQDVLYFNEGECPMCELENTNTGKVKNISKALHNGEELTEGIFNSVERVVEKDYRS